MIRKATEEDIPRLMELLHQVNMVHYELRPDLFKPITTKSEYWQKGDTAVTIQTKTIETYDASKKML